MKRALAAVAVALSTAALAQDQYTFLSFKNLSDSAHRFQYYVDDRTPMPAGLAIATVKTAADNAWDKWNAVSCAAPKSQSMGYTTGTVPQPTDPYDAFNVTPVFVTSNTEPFYSNIFNTGLDAVTLPLQYAGVLQQCDIYLNATTATWATAVSTPSNAVDVESVMLHETGHCLGINHPLDMSSVMVAAILPGQQKRQLSTFDANLLCQRYPVAGAVGSPCPDGGGCGSLRCLTGAGIPPEKYCSRGCNTGTGGAECDLPLQCQPSAAFNPTFDGACLRPSTQVTQVGKSCTADSECGSNVGICEPPLMVATGTTYWINGYCWQDCSAGRPACPGGSACTILGGVSMCLQSCRVGYADCRPGYACAATINGGVCAPRCETNGDCGGATAGFACRTCDGLCVSINSQTQPGDICLNDSTCGFGQTCISLDPRSGVRLCSSACGAGCQTCPMGSTCQPVPTAGNEFFCLRNCTTSVSCPTGLQCANLPTGRACTPPCFNDLDCPVGTICNAGECGNPMVDPDGGCGLLCTPGQDGGTPIKPRPKDAGTGGGGSGGCGCNSSPASLLFALMGLVFVRPRSRPCRRRQ